MRRLPFEYAVRNLGRTPSRLVMSVGGTMLVVLLVIAASGFVTGMQHALKSSGATNNVILMGAGSEESIERSELPMRAAAIAAASIPNVRTKAGVEAVSPEIYLAMPLKREVASDEGLVVIRGVTPAAFIVHEEVRILEGRLPERGANELALGRLAAVALGFHIPGEAINEQFFVDTTAFTVVGILGADGGIVEGECWMPLTDLLIVAQRDSLSCIVMSLTNDDISSVEAFAARRLDLELIAQRESTYYATLSSFYGPIRWMVFATAVLIGVGGVIGGLNTTYAAFASREREIGTLQAIGYSRRAIVRSLLEESLLAASIGALLATGLAVWLLDGIVIRFSMGVFGISITPSVLAIGLGSGLALGLVGAIVPAIRCLRLPIPEALRSA